MKTPLKYTKVRTIKLTTVQDETLKKMKSYNIDVSRFVREAIAEKIKREYKDLIPKSEKEYCPF